MKKFGRGITAAFSPYTYTWENFEEAKSQLVGRRKEVLATGMMSVPLMLFYLSSRAKRINRAKREYFLNQMMKRKFIADELGLKP
jgi:hypothetical protein